MRQSIEEIKLRKQNSRNATHLESQIKKEKLRQPTQESTIERSIQIKLLKFVKVQLRSSQIKKVKLRKPKPKRKIDKDKSRK